MGTKGRAALAATVTAALLAVGPASALATVTTITGDNGQPAVMNPAAPPTLRTMDIRTSTSKSAGDTAYTIQAFDPAGTPIGSWDTGDCWTINDVGNTLPYRGNGAYRVVVTRFTNSTCTAGAAATTYAYTVAASVAITAPAGPVLIRQKNSYTTIQQQLGFTGNPGNPSYEVRYARGGVIGPDGAISGTSSSAFVNTTSSTVGLSLSDPGSYVVVARATADGYATAWSAPVTVTAQAPFDLSSTSFPDSIGPRYRLRGTLREDTARGKVSIFLARGARKGKYHRIGRARISSKGTFALRFTQRRTGTYRLKFSFKGSATTQRGTVEEKIRISRRIIG